MKTTIAILALSFTGCSFLGSGGLFAKARKVDDQPKNAEAVSITQFALVNITSRNVIGVNPDSLPVEK